MRKQLEILLDNHIIDENYKLNKDSLYSIPCINETNETGQVIGTDTRVRVPYPGQYPYFPVVRLILIFPGCQFYIGTGFLIGANKLVTAGHCIYDHGTQEFVQDIIAIAEPGTANNHYGICTGYQYSPNYLISKKPENDWAVMKLDMQLGGYAGILPIADWSTLTPFAVYIGEIPGYPAVAHKRATNIMWTASGQVTWPPGKKVLNYRISTSGGQSGAPVLIQDSGQYYAAGIHVTGSSAGNSARAIDTDLFYTLLSY